MSFGVVYFLEQAAGRVYEAVITSNPEGSTRSPIYTMLSDFERGSPCAGVSVVDTIPNGTNFTTQLAEGACAFLNQAVALLSNSNTSTPGSDCMIAQFNAATSGPDSGCDVDTSYAWLIGLGAVLVGGAVGVGACAWYDISKRNKETVANSESNARLLEP